MEPRIELCGGDFVLSVAGGRTILTAVAPAPTTRKQITVKGRYFEWPHREWEFLRKLADRFYQCKDLDAELERVEEQSRKRWISAELPIVNDDNSVPRFWAAHSLELHVSRKRGYIRIGGRTYGHRAELRRMKFAWDRGLKMWTAPFSDVLLRRATDFVRNHDRKVDPVAAGMVRCIHCGRWTPGNK